MRLNRKGEPVCESGEVRVGNFFVKAESCGMVKLTDLSGLLVHRVSDGLPIGALLSDGVSRALDGDAKAGDFLHLYASLVYLFSTVVPMVSTGDDGTVEYNFWQEAHGFLQRAADMSKRLYGVKDDPAPEEDAGLLDGVKDAVALEDELRAMADGGDFIELAE